jgi:hypothetical protein
MFSLLNKLSWMASISLGFLITFLLGVIFDVIDHGGLDTETFILWIIFTVGIGAIWKRNFFSKEYLRTICYSYFPQGRNGEKDEMEQTIQKIYSSKEEEKKTSPFSTTHSSRQSVFRTALRNDDGKEVSQEISSLKEGESIEAFSVSPSSSQKSIFRSFIANKNTEEKQQEKNLRKNAIKQFFSENLLAKGGGMLLFLGVLFLLQLVYTQIGPVGKVLIGFFIGFTLYGTGIFLGTKKLTKESRILLGTGIVVNYLVILSGRYLIGETFTDITLFSESITFLFLICNTVLAIVTALIYRSKFLLQSSFLFAFIVPFLIGAEDQDVPYTLVGYALIVSLGGIILHILLRKYKTHSLHHLLTIATLGGNILLVLAPFHTSIDWLVKLGATAFLSLIILFTVYHKGRKEYIPAYFLVAYIALAFHLALGNIVLHLQFHSGIIAFGYTLYSLIFFGGGIFVFLTTSLISLFSILFLPLLIFLGLIFWGGISFLFVPFLLIGIIILYLGAFFFLTKYISSFLHYLFFGILGGALIFTIIFFSFTEGLSSIDVNIYVFPYTLAIIGSTFLFLLASYFFSTKKDLSYLYSLGTFFSALLLFSVLSRSGTTLLPSIFSSFLFVLISALFPFFHTNFLKADIKNSIGGLITGAFFGVGTLFYFGEKYFSGVTLGLAFLGFALFYFSLGYVSYFILRKCIQEKQEQQLQTSGKNILYSFLGISLSLFSLSVAFVFSKHSEIVSAIWLFEASILFFLFQKTKNIKIYSAGVILMGIGIVKLISLVHVIQTKEFFTLIPLAIISGSFLFNIRSLSSEKRVLRLFHDAGHVLGMASIGGLLLIIIPSHQYGWAIFGIAITSSLLLFFYTRIFSGSIQGIFEKIFILFLFFHLFEVDMIFHNIEQNDLQILKAVQYISTGIFLLPFLFLQKSVNKRPGSLFSGLFFLYNFLITTYFVYDIFQENIFIITLYWGMLAFLLCGYGIQKNRISFRTIGLYILSLTTGKILLYDIWYEVEGGITRVLALMAVGILMIIISVFYSKKYGNALRGEFSLKNVKL